MCVRSSALGTFRLISCRSHSLRDREKNLPRKSSANVQRLPLKYLTRAGALRGGGRNPHVTGEITHRVSLAVKHRVAFFPFRLTSKKKRNTREKCRDAARAVRERPRPRQRRAAAERGFSFPLAEFIGFFAREIMRNASVPGRRFISLPLWNISPLRSSSWPATLLAITKKPESFHVTCNWRSATTRS